MQMRIEQSKKKAKKGQSTNIVTADMIADI